MSLTFPSPDTAETRLARTLFIVEATSFERMSLWAHHSEDAVYPLYNPRRGVPAYSQHKWEDIPNGYGVTVNPSGKRPVCILLTWVRIDGQLVMFWEGCSKLVDYNLIDKWLEEHFKGTYDNNTRRAECDAMNFGQCLGAIKDVNDKAAAPVG